MPDPTFTLFEVVASELCTTTSRVLTERDLERADENNPFLGELKRQYSCDGDGAILAAVAAISSHFAERDSLMPFTYDSETSRFTASDQEYLAFITRMAELRSKGLSAKDFEVAVLGRLALRVTGSLHRVGFPRDTRKTTTSCNEHLANIGFRSGVLKGRQKDGGLDILWILPLGAFPYRPMAIVQCKNGELSWKDADTSYATCTRTMSRHAGLLLEAHLQCVLFNDYVSPEQLPDDMMQYIPLGLSDLAKPLTLIPTQVLI
jgi:hypothetical protein